MPTVTDILRTLFDFAPEEGKIDSDNIGLLAGDPDAEVSRVLTALDITLDTIGEARDIGAQLIVAHHPVIFRPITAVTGDTVTGRRLLALLSGGMAAICMHTNLDAAPRGVNDALAEACGLRELTLPDVESGNYADGTRYAISRAGYLSEPTPLSDFLTQLKKSLGSNGLRYVDAQRPVHHVGVVGGSGGDDLETIYKHGCDTFVTADVKHSTFLAARELGVNLIDAGHFPTENTVVPRLRGLLRAAYPQLDVRISERGRQPEQYFV